MELLYGLFRSRVAGKVLVYYYIYVHCTNILLFFLKSHAGLITKNFARIYTTSSQSFFCVFAMHTFASQLCLRRQGYQYLKGICIGKYVQTSPVFLSTHFTIITLNIPDRLNIDICSVHSYSHIQRHIH